MDSNTTVGVVGAGMVGMSFAYSLMQSGLAGRIVLVDRDTARAEGEAMDLNHGLPFVGPMRISQGDYADLAGASVTVVCAGANQRPGQSRLDLLKHNAAVIREVAGRTAAANPGGILLIASNPVDLLTWIAAEESGLAQGRVFGSGTVLDTARLRYLLAEHYAVDPRSVHAWVIGEHGDHSVPVWSIANIAGVPLSDFRTPQHPVHDPAVLDDIARQTREAARVIIERKRATYYAIGLTLLRIVEAILKNQCTVLSVTSPMTGQYGVSGMSLSLPSIVCRDGVHSILDLPISQAESEAFRTAGTVLTERMSELG